MVTVTIETIGAAGTFPTITDWITDVGAGNLVTDDEVRIGELIDSSYEESGTAIAFTGLAAGESDATRYPWLRAQAGNEYNPISGSGAKIIQTGFAATGSVLVVSGMPFLRLSGFGVFEQSGSSGNARQCLQVSSASVSVARVYFERLAGTNAGASGIEFVTASSNLGALYSCIAVGGGGAGMAQGFELDGTNLSVYNCIAYRCGITGSNLGRGFECDGTGTIRNCVAAETVGAGSEQDFEFNSFTNSNNYSEDSTGNLTGWDPTSSTGDWEDAINGDFRLTSGSVGTDAGFDLDGTIAIGDFGRPDFRVWVHNQDESGWECGAYDSGGPARTVQFMPSTAPVEGTFALEQEFVVQFSPALAGVTGTFELGAAFALQFAATTAPVEGVFRGAAGVRVEATTQARGGLAPSGGLQGHAVESGGVAGGVAPSGGIVGALPDSGGISGGIL